MGLSKAISTLIGVKSIVALIIALVTKSHDPLSRQSSTGHVMQFAWGRCFKGWCKGKNDFNTRIDLGLYSCR